MTNDDSELHNMGLSIKTIAEILAKIPTFISAAERLRKFRIFVFTKKPKPPIAWELSNLPSSKTLITADEMARAFPKDMLRKWDVKVIALQKKRIGVAELDIAI
ncbi:hypothetical protein L914_07268 [Phytophthora nicotianae]|uniref:Uncharacterized protein n=1 Tax=Phytophthora nicotianae TaxID=4792 RepID=W2NHY2_PHYNI|nr:hypothetical protein L914_07268 [Phytophthora nicotianae]